jgi:hypothetical protein
MSIIEVSLLFLLFVLVAAGAGLVWLGFLRATDKE